MSDNDLIFRGDVKAFEQAVIHYSADYPDGHLVYAVTIKDIDCIPPVQLQYEMTAREYEKVKDRMRRSNGTDNAYGLYVRALFEGQIDEAVAIVEKWARENPERSEE